MKNEVTALNDMPRALATRIETAREEVLDLALDGEWSVRTILAHLRDEEALVFRMRVERMLSENEPVFARFPPEAWLEQRQTARDSMRELLQDFALQRKASVNLLERLNEDEQQRKGYHPDKGLAGSSWIIRSGPAPEPGGEPSGVSEFTIASWVAYWNAHDREHLAQIDRTLELRAR